MFDSPWIALDRPDRPFPLVVLHRGDPDGRCAMRRPARAARASGRCCGIAASGSGRLGAFMATLDRPRLAGLSGLSVGAGALGLDRAGLPDRGGHRAGPHHARPAPRNGSGSSAPGAPSPITRSCWPALLTMLCALQLRGRKHLWRCWTFGCSSVARISAKLNLYLGVRKINTEFMPDPLNRTCPAISAFAG
jgi:hypothetical protein